MLNLVVHMATLCSQIFRRNQQLSIKPRNEFSLLLRTVSILLQLPWLTEQGAKEHGQLAPLCVRPHVGHSGASRVNALKTKTTNND
jgi:hypothetical protein